MKLISILSEMQPFGTITINAMVFWYSGIQPAVETKVPLLN